MIRRTPYARLDGAPRPGCAPCFSSLARALVEETQMFKNNVAAALMAGLLFVISSAPVSAALPADRVMTCEIRETPGDSTSQLLYTQEMGLTAKEQDGNSIGWAVASVTIKEIDANGDVINTWVDNSPSVSSSDGLWWNCAPCFSSLARALVEETQMFKNNVAAALMAGLLFVISSAPVSAALPADRVMTCEIRETPGDSTSQLLYTQEMGLTAKEQDGNSIGWAVASVTIKEIDANGDVINTWIDNSPSVSSSDGLWWITHADPDNPVDSEFANSPLIDGTAGGDMDYEFQGLGEPAEATTPLTFLVNLVLWPQSFPDPDVAYQSDPVIVHVINDPPL